MIPVTVHSYNNTGTTNKKDELFYLIATKSIREGTHKRCGKSHIEKIRGWVSSYRFGLLLNAMLRGLLHKYSL